MLMDNIRDKELCLWNFSIRKAVLLPCCPFKYGFFDVRCLLGFAPLSNDYKVLFIKCVDTTAFAFGIAVHSLRDHVWKVKHHRFKVPRWCFEELEGPNGSGAVFAQGVVYWRPCYHRWPDESTQLVCFNFDAEDFSYIKLPGMEGDMFRFIFVLKGSLAVLGVSTMKSCIWVMEMCGTELWRQYWKGDTNSDVYEFFNSFSYNDYEILYIEHTGKLLIQSFRKLMLYNLVESNQTQCLGKSVPLWFVEIFVESLVLHKGYSGVALTSQGLEDNTKLGAY